MKDKLHLDESRIETVRKVFSVVSILGIVTSIVLAVLAYRNGLFSDPRIMQRFLERAGIWGPLLFVVLQIVQCIIPIIPGGITSLVGALIFGPWLGFVLNYIGIYIGEVIIFLMARLLGPNFMRAVVKEETFQKYSSWMTENDAKIKKFFVMTMVLPGMPDDVICMLVGLTKMDVRFYLFHLAWTKVPSLLAYTLFLDKAVESGGQVLDWLKTMLNGLMHR
ncbi:MAG: TVP38/TMEM64 family protein [Peptoniphilaceae bacterium]|nr:TVP38/TMEM64 family protein [Peptoniphilaceae bacterium]MDY6085717.1 TVP38/TMEM64 family protein [Peptoniphilaceae bacterium]